MTKEDVLEELVTHKILQSPSLTRAFHKVDRRDFVASHLAAEAYADYPLPLGFEQTMPVPLAVAFMLELLLPRPGERVLEIGTGSGWQAALLGYALSEGVPPERYARSPAVVTVERILPLSEIAKENLRKCAALPKGVVHVVAGDGMRGYAKYAPYDRIISTIVTSSVPAAWKEQLRIGGRIVSPNEDVIEVHDKLSAIDYNTRAYHGLGFISLEGEGDAS
ncbi:MAG: protein-L-isoaspartate O-methyltransferase [Candidatus Liptonbacteria bacterium]|nr:protein-L-isoaspartate O-methyltransferase [Candidatus Liptonbacteria bacterium]